MKRGSVADNNPCRWSLPPSWDVRAWSRERRKRKSRIRELPVHTSRTNATGWHEELEVSPGLYGIANLTDEAINSMAVGMAAVRA